MLRMTPEVRDQMFAHGLVALPNEACGMFSASVGVDLVDYFHPMRNIAESSTVFVLDGQEMLDLERNVEGAGREIIGVMHSHTKTSAYPSPTDLRDSDKFDPLGTYSHVIVSLRHAEPALRCFRIFGSDVVELPVVVTDGDDDLQDEGGTVAVAAAVPLRSVD
jgi:proteasome lid subunit RPN8/RPN11